MTCIVGLVSEGEVWLGGDSGAFCGWNVLVKPAGKVFRRGEFVMGLAGDSRMGELLRYSFTPPVIDEAYRSEATPPDLHRYMVTTFVDALRACLREAGYAEKENNKESAGGLFLVGVRGRLFCVHSDYGVTETMTPYRAIGCGGDYASGAMYITAGQGMGAAERIYTALGAAQHHSAGVRGPFTIVREQAG